VGRMFHLSLSYQFHIIIFHYHLMLLI